MGYGREGAATTADDEADRPRSSRAQQLTGADNLRLQEVASVELTVPEIMPVFPAEKPERVWQRKCAAIQTGYCGRKII